MRFSEGLNLPFRPLSLEVLGLISPIKTITKHNPEEDPVDTVPNESEDGYISPNRRGARENYAPKERIHANITAILNGFEAYGQQRRQ